MKGNEEMGEKDFLGAAQEEVAQKELTGAWPKEKAQKIQAETLKERFHNWMMFCFCNAFIIPALFAIGLKNIQSPAEVGDYTFGWVLVVAMGLVTGIVNVWEVIQRRERERPKREMLLRYFRMESIVAVITGATLGFYAYLLFTNVLVERPHDHWVIMLTYVWLGGTAAIFAGAALWDFWRYQKTPDVRTGHAKITQF